MALRTRRTGSGDYGRWIKALVAGEPGAGKTLFASTWPDVLYLNAEGGLMSVADRNVLVQDIEDSQTLLEAIVALRQDPAVREKIFGGPVGTVVLDTLDEVARLLQRERITETRKDGMQMADWGWFGDQLRGIIRGLRNLEMHVILNVHVRTHEDSENGSLLIKPAIQGQVGDELAGYVDLALLMKASPVQKVVEGEVVREQARVLSSFPTSRFPWLKDRSGKLPTEFEVNFDDDFKRLDALIFGGREVDRTTIVQPPAPTIVETPVAEAPAKRTRAKKTEPETTPLTPPTPPTEAGPPPGVDAETGEIAPTVPNEADDPHPPLPDPPTPEPVPEPSPGPEPQAAKEEEPKNKMGLPDDGPPWQCADCGESFDDPDQAALSMIRFRRRLDGKCFRAAKSAKAK